MHVIWNNITSVYWMCFVHSRRGKFSLTTLSLQAFTCSKSTAETPKQGVKLVQSYQ